MNKLLAYSAALLLLLLLAAPNKNSGLQSTQAAEAPATQDHDKPEHPKWSYSGALGPQHWAENYPDCGRKDQSPVDITTSQSAKLPEIEFHYRSSPLFIENNGHTIQVDFPESEASANTVTIGGDEYKLAQFHFHQPSEEKLQGRSQDMVVHLGASARRRCLHASGCGLRASENRCGQLPHRYAMAAHSQRG